MSERITNIHELDGLSVKDSKHMPHPVDLARWEREGLYRIDADRGVFCVNWLRVRETGDAKYRVMYEITRAANLRNGL